MSIRAQVYCHKEPNRFDRRGYIYCWYYRVFNADTGKLLASDNTGDWRKMLDSALDTVGAARHCARLGILKKARSW